MFKSIKLFFSDMVKDTSGHVNSKIFMGIISFIIALVVNEVRKSKPKTKIVKEVQYITKPDDKITVKPEEMKEEIKKELKEEMKKEAKEKKDSKLERQISDLIEKIKEILSEEKSIEEPQKRLGSKPTQILFLDIKNTNRISLSIFF